MLGPPTILISLSDVRFLKCKMLVNVLSYDFLILTAQQEAFMFIFLTDLAKVLQV